MSSFESTLIFLWIVAFIGVLIYRIISSIREFKNNNLQKKISQSAQVLEVDGKNARLLINQHLNATPSNKVKFLLPDNTTITLRVSLIWEDNKSIKVGDSGILTYQGTRFYSFKKNG